MKFFQELGKALGKAWEQEGNHWASFPKLAHAALKAQPPSQFVHVDELVTWVLEAQELPEQLDLAANFGEPPVTLFRGNGFLIEAYFWMDGTTTIHQHAFGGAFHVFDGSSLHTTYDFYQQVAYGKDVLLGHLTTTGSVYLKKGTTHVIESDNRFIHSLFHLQRPSVTIVVRTEARPRELQYVYWWPSLAVAPLDHRRPALIRRLQLLNMLRESGHPDFRAMMERAVLEAPPGDLVHLLEAHRGDFVDRPMEFAELLNKLQQRHGGLMSGLTAAFKHLSKVQAIVQLRRAVTDLETRYFLALLLNLHSGDQVKRMLAERYPHQALLPLMGRCLAQIFSTQIETLPQDPLALPIMKSYLAEENPLENADFRRDASEARIAEILGQLRSCLILRPFFD